MKKTITLKGFLIIILLSGSIIKAQIPFDHVIIDTNGPTDPWGKGSDDINGDGYPDLIAGGWTGGGLVWYEYPDWTKHSIADDIISTDIDVADIDNDGLTDIVAVSKKSLQWYKKPGWQKYEVATSISLHDVEVADFNGDGKLDMVARNQEYWFNNGDVLHFYIQGQTPTEWSYSTISCPNGEGLKVFDINGDKKPDVIVNGMWYENTGNINNWISHTFSSSWNYNHTYIDIGDINGNGLMDIVLSPSEKAGLKHKIAWYEHPSDPNTTWPEHIVADNVEAVHHFIGTGDFNNDGKTDIATAEMQQGADPDEVAIFINQDNGTNWQKQVLSNNGSHSMQIVDIGNDGDLDLFGANWDQNNQIDLWVNKLNNTNPPPPPATNLDDWERHVIDPAKEWRAVFIDGKDLDGDGLKDIIAGAWWYKNPGSASGSWVKHTIGTPLNNMAYVYDFDGDGDLDILGTEGEGADANSNFVWAQNDGSGNFTILDNIEAGQGDFLQGVAIVRKDNLTPYQIALSWHEPGHGVQTLTVPADPLNNTWTWEKISDESQDECLTAGDIDRDGDPDLLMGTKWLRNDGGSWSLFTLNPASGLPDRNKLADINQNGRLDAVVGYEAISVEGKLAWYEQPATATDNWPEHVIDSVVGPMSVDAVDMDGDEDIDVVVGEHNLKYPSTARMLIYENTDGKGTSWLQHQVYQGDENHDGAVTVDIDNDGDLDILSIGWGHPRVLLYENLAISGSNTPPVLANIESGAASYTEGDAGIQITNSLTVSDADNADLQYATVKISSNFNSSEDKLKFTNTSLISGSFDNVSGKLTLSGTASVSDYQKALRSISYQNSSNNPDSRTRTISFFVSDGIDSSNLATRRINVYPVNDAPNLTNLESDDLKCTPGDDPVTITGSIKISDVDNTNLQKGQISISYNYIPGEDILSLPTTGNGINASFDASSGVLTLTGDAAIEKWQEILRNVTYQNNSTKKQQNIRKISFLVNDGTTKSNVVERTVSLIPVNEAPQISNIEQYPVKYMINSAPVHITGTFQITDSDDENLQSATIHIAENYKIGEDQLVAVEPDSLTTYFNSVSGSLIITGDAPIGVYQSAIRSVTFSSSNSDYNSGTRRLEFSVFDGTTKSNVVSRNIEIVSDQTPPEIQNIEMTSLAYLEKNTAVTITSSLIVNQPSNQTVNRAEVKFLKGFIPEEDKLIYNSQNTISSNFSDQTGVLTFTGEATAEEYQQALRSVEYKNISGTGPSGTEKIITFTAWNGDLQSNTQGRKIIFANNNAKPILGEIEGFQLLYENGGTYVPITNTISIIDLDDDYMTGATVEITSDYHQGEDYLEFENTETIYGIFDYTSGKMVLSGIDTKAKYQEALRSTHYKNTKGKTNYTPGVRVISFTLNDGQGFSNNLNRKIAVSIITRSEDLNLPDKLKIYPNPSPGYFTIQLVLPEKLPVQIKILNLTGKTVYFDSEKVYKTGENTIHIKLNSLPLGVYFVQIKIGAQQFVKKLILSQ